MGTPTDNKNDWCEFDSELFPPGKTPRRAKVDFSGIAATLPTIPLPNRYSFQLIQSSAIYWGFSDPTPEPEFSYPYYQNIVTMQLEPGYSGIYWFYAYFTEYGAGTGYSCFSGGNAADLAMSWLNSYTPSINELYGGQGTAVFYGQYNTKNSLAQIATLAGMNPSKKDLYESSIVTASTVLSRIARRADHSCIYVKRGI